jgi:hypothetical protein
MDHVPAFSAFFLKVNSRDFPDNTHLSQRRPLDVVLGRFQRPKGSPYFLVLVFETRFGCGNVRLVIIPLLCPAQPMGRL